MLTDTTTTLFGLATVRAESALIVDAACYYAHTCNTRACMVALYGSIGASCRDGNIVRQSPQNRPTYSASTYVTPKKADCILLLAVMFPLLEEITFPDLELSVSPLPACETAAPRCLRRPLLAGVAGHLEFSNECRYSRLNVSGPVLPLWPLVYQRNQTNNAQLGG